VPGILNFLPAITVIFAPVEIVWGVFRMHSLLAEGLIIISEQSGKIAGGHHIIFPV
jgi:hypothetical protein